METLREPEDADTSIFVSLAPEQRKRVASLVEPIFQENMAMWASGYAASAEATPVTQTPSFQALLNVSLLHMSEVLWLTLSARGSTDLRY